MATVRQLEDLCENIRRLSNQATTEPLTKEQEAELMHAFNKMRRLMDDLIPKELRAQAKNQIRQLYDQPQSQSQLQSQSQSQSQSQLQSQSQSQSQPEASSAPLGMTQPIVQSSSSVSSPPISLQQSQSQSQPHSQSQHHHNHQRPRDAPTSHEMASEAANALRDLASSRGFPLQTTMPPINTNAHDFQRNHHTQQQLQQLHHHSSPHHNHLHQLQIQPQHPLHPTSVYPLQVQPQHSPNRPPGPKSVYSKDA